MSSDNTHESRPYWNPYVAGFGLGLVLLACFLIMGWGLGASSAFASMVATTVKGAVPSLAERSAFFREYAGHPFSEWLTWEVLGVVVGGLVSGLLANRVRVTVDHGPRFTRARRFAFAFLGGMIMAAGAKIGGGCTSGQALTGGAQLNLGSWVFMFSVFGGGYMVAWFFRKQWI